MLQSWWVSLSLSLSLSLSPPPPPSLSRCDDTLDYYMYLTTSVRPKMRSLSKLPPVVCNFEVIYKEMNIHRRPPRRWVHLYTTYMYNEFTMQQWRQQFSVYFTLLLMWSLFVLALTFSCVLSLCRSLSLSHSHPPSPKQTSANSHT